MALDHARRIWGSRSLSLDRGWRSPPPIEPVLPIPVSAAGRRPPGSQGWKSFRPCSRGMY